jgi:hypothetical protein
MDSHSSRMRSLSHNPSRPNLKASNSFNLLSSLPKPNQRGKINRQLSHSTKPKEAISSLLKVSNPSSLSGSKLSSIHSSSMVSPNSNTASSNTDNSHNNISSSLNSSMDSHSSRMRSLSNMVASKPKDIQPASNSKSRRGISNQEHKSRCSQAINNPWVEFRCKPDSANLEFK